MAGHYPDNGAATNVFGRRQLREDGARLLYEANYQAPPDMRVSESWRLSDSGSPVAPPPIGVERRTELARIRSGLPENSLNLPRYAPDSNTLWKALFDCRHGAHLAATNGVDPRGRQNSEGWRQWWGVTGRTLEYIVEHIEGGNTPKYDYPTPPALSHHRGNSWMPRRMETATSSSFGSRSRSSGSPALLPVKPEL
ncbi:Homeobox protein KNOX3 [Hordeum vulgare]|nr:Homeobox protein KNOX3 [Hordeum vulgare]